MTRILVIDDEHLLMNDIIELLGYEGYEAFGASTGEEGLRLLRETPPDLILCDMMMPEVNGYDVLRAVRGNPKTAEIPFIFLSAVTDPDTREASIAEGANLYLTKPFAHFELIDAITTCLTAA